MIPRRDSGSTSSLLLRNSSEEVLTLSTNGHGGYAGAEIDAGRRDLTELYVYVVQTPGSG